MPVRYIPLQWLPLDVSNSRVTAWKVCGSVWIWGFAPRGKCLSPRGGARNRETYNTPLEWTVELATSPLRAMGWTTHPLDGPNPRMDHVMDHTPQDRFLLHKPGMDYNRPPVDRMTVKCKNITSPQFRLRALMISQFKGGRVRFASDENFQNLVHFHSVTAHSPLLRLLKLHYSEKALIKWDKSKDISVMILSPLHDKKPEFIIQAS